MVASAVRCGRPAASLRSIGLWTAALLAALGVSLTPCQGAAAIPWPGETWSAAVDLTPLNPSGWSSNLSGAYWNPVTRRLWVCTNGPAVFWSLMEDGLGGFAIERSYAGTGDLEGITQAPGAPDRVFVIDEQARVLRSYLVSTGASSTTWLLSSIPDWGNSGPEGIAFVPDAWLTQSGFVDGGGAPYPQSVHGANGFGALLFVAVQASGWVYVFDLRNDGTFVFVGRYLTSRTESCEMTFDASTGRMHILHNTDGNLIEITDLTSQVSGSDRKFTTQGEVQVPSGSNIEGFAMTPALDASSAVGDNWCFFTDDSNVSGALRWFSGLHPTLAKQSGDAQTAETNSNLPVSPAVLAADAFTSPLRGFSVEFSVTGGGGSVTGPSALTGGNGVAAVGSWRVGPVPGANSLSAAGAGLSGSPVVFTALGQDTVPPSVTVEQQGAQPDPTNALPITFDVVFTEDVTGFDAPDVMQTGSASGVTFAVTPVDAARYTVQATIVNTDGVVQPSIMAGSCVDIAGNGNHASTSTDNSVLLDRVGPGASIALDDPSPTILNAVRFSVDFTAPVSPTFTAEDVSLAGSLHDSVSVSVTGGDPDYTVTVTMDDGDDDGTIGIVVGKEVADSDGNPFGGGASPLCTVHNWFGFTSDPASSKQYEGDAATLFVASSHGNSAPAHRWLFDSGTGMPHVIGSQPAVTLSGLAFGQRGEYWCEVTYDGIAYESGHAYLSVEPRVSVMGPLGAERVAGESHTFSVEAVGGYAPLSYAWIKNGQPIPGAPNQPEYTLSNLQAGDSGSYAVEVVDSYEDEAVSGEAVLAVSEGTPAVGFAGLAVLAGLLAVVAAKKSGGR